uniref:Uncharacterized protein n=1 Tax=Callithrix jacchus TaxID=9483 RepID=A0A8I3WZJ3_CALJA
MISAHRDLRLTSSSDLPASVSGVAGITGMHHHAQPIFVCLVEMGFQHVGRVGLKLWTSGDPPTSASQSAGITGVSHLARLYLFFSCSRVCHGTDIHSLFRHLPTPFSNEPLETSRLLLSQVTPPSISRDLPPWANIQALLHDRDQETRLQDHRSHASIMLAHNSKYIVTHRIFQNKGYSLGSLDPLVIEFKGHKRFWQLSEVRFQSSCNRMGVCRVLLHIHHAAVQGSFQLLQLGGRGGYAEESLPTGQTVSAQQLQGATAKHADPTSAHFSLQNLLNVPSQHHFQISHAFCSLLSLL